MRAASAHNDTTSQSMGRAARKGETARALPPFWASFRLIPLALLTAITLLGAGLVAKALYIPLKAEVAQILLDRAFSQSVASGEPVKPWSWADTVPVARVSAARLGVSEVVLSGGSGEALAFGPTALVDARGAGASVLAGHRDTHFTFIAELQTGDQITLERIDGSVEAFRITHFETVRWDEFAYPTNGGAGLLALTTCYPFGTDEPGPLRRVAWAARIG